MLLIRMWINSFRLDVDTAMAKGRMTCCLVVHVLTTKRTPVVVRCYKWRGYLANEGAHLRLITKHYLNHEMAPELTLASPQESVEAAGTISLESPNLQHRK
jgi:hypothetical protein